MRMLGGHPCAVQLHAVYEDASTYYLVRAGLQTPTHMLNLRQACSIYHMLNISQACRLMTCTCVVVHS